MMTSLKNRAESIIKAAKGFDIWLRQDEINEFTDIF